MLANTREFVRKHKFATWIFDSGTEERPRSGTS